MTILSIMLAYLWEAKYPGFHKSVVISWKVVEAVVLVLPLILKYESNLWQKKFI